jgi:hypothetical protein
VKFDGFVFTTCSAAAVARVRDLHGLAIVASTVAEGTTQSAGLLPRICPHNRERNLATATRAVGFAWSNTAAAHDGSYRITVQAIVLGSTSKEVEEKSALA